MRTAIQKHSGNMPRCGLALERRLWSGRLRSTSRGLNPVDYRRSGYEDEKAALNNSGTRATETAAKKEYNEAYKEVKRSIRADKRGHVDNLARQAE